MTHSVVFYFAITLVFFQVKHFIADFILQTRYMLGKFNQVGWIKPLTAHVAVHATFTTAFVFGALFERSDALLLALLFGLFDFIVHFTMDRVKASPTILGRYKPTQKAFWVCLGVDQMVHHITHYVIIIGVFLLLIGA